MMYLNHSRAELKKFTNARLVSIGHGILKKLPKTTLVNTVLKLEMLAKSKGIKSIGKAVRSKARKVRSKARKVRKRVTRRRAKTARSFPKKLGGKRYTNGRIFKKYSKKPRRLIKGTPEAKRYMAKIRAMR